ncbi:MAG TPA: beta-galactosidase [Chloroflexota bacterium]|nr:beta-galactosidase [Chloroflexota bacterium]
MSAGFVAVAPGGRGFERDGRPFVPWGLNYDRSYHRGADVLLEELLERDPAKLDADFAQARASGANTIRLFLQHARYQPQPGRIEARALEGLDVAVAAARRHGLLVDLTGLSHIDTSAPATWYATASDEEILAAEAHFWEALARHFAEEPAIFCFNLQNEPTVNWQDSRLITTGYFAMPDGRRFSYVNSHLKEVRAAWGEWVRGRYAGPGALARAWADFPTPVEDWEHVEPPQGERRGDPRLLDFQAFREDYAERWTRTLVTAIRRHDRRHLITIGLLPSSVPLIGPARQYSGFAPGRVAPYLDFLAIHLYPQRAAPPGEVLGANLAHHELVLLALLAGGGGKPVVVEEWFALGEGLRQGHISWGGWFDAFLACSRPLASGWVSFYHALLNDRPGAAVPPAYQEWLERFRATGRAVEAGDFPGPRSGDQGRDQGREPAGGADFVLDGPALLTSGAARAEALEAYGALRGGPPRRGAPRGQGQRPPGVRWAGVEPRGPGSGRE